MTRRAAPRWTAAGSWIGTVTAGIASVMRSVAPRLVAVTCVASLALTAGCGEGRPNRVPVAGQVLIDGQPLAGGMVRFVPEGARPSIGRLDEEGRFDLTCYDGSDGAVVGIHRVEVAAVDLASSALAETSDTEADEPRVAAPRRYASVETSGLVTEISGPTDDLRIELTWGGATP